MRSSFHFSPAILGIAPLFALVAGCSVSATRQTMMPAAAESSPSARSGGFNGSGDVLIADQWNNRIIEVDKHHRIVWQFGDESADAGPKSIVGPNDAERFGDLTLVAGTGLPSGTIPACSNHACQDNRVIVVNKAGKIVWQYGKTGVPGSRPGLLNAPVSAVHLANGDVLVTDQGNQRVIEISKSKNIVWLITDSGHSRIVEISSTGSAVWSFMTNEQRGSIGNPQPSHAVRLKNGDTLISNQIDDTVLDVNAAGTIVWQQGKTALPGTKFDELNWPYDAKRIGDFTGLTPP